ncbi:Putative cystathionine gamma-lyase 2; AltName: Full=Gamma-cystathionase [Serendipita indica DSM 11827]|nr:Putative cystathionine gamma-lyase 2; AltName: Full=Gamma-cystathionase [Serendipita indica DSM 11827]
MASSPYSFGTKAIHVGSDPSSETGAVIPSISLSTTYKQDSVGVHKGYEYSRSDNPNRNALEKQLAALEAGQHALAFASGSAATATVMSAVGTAHIISVSDVYGGTHRYMTKVASELSNLQVTWLDLDTVSEQTIIDSIRENTKLVWVETPTNPTLRVIDIAYVANILSNHPSQPLLLVDNTFMSPYYQSPLALGADIVLHSLTKYVNGHSDVVMGALILPEPSPTSKPLLAPFLSKLRFLQNAIGAVPSPYDSWLAQRGAKTLYLRMRAHGLGALSVAHALERAKARGQVRDVIYPGLPSSSRFDVARRNTSAHAKAWIDTLRNSIVPGLGLEESGRGYDPELDGIPFGGMISFRINESLGGVESLVEVPEKMTHGGLSEAERASLGIGPDLIRLSIGVEDAVDLIADLERALDAAIPPVETSPNVPQLRFDIQPSDAASEVSDESPLATRLPSATPSEYGDAVKETL